jgi:hypothetical protein
LEYETQLRRALDEVRFWQEQLQAISEIEL